MNYYVGGYASEKNQGIYLIDDDLNVVSHLVDEDGTSYFTVDRDQVITILKRNNQGGIAVFEKGNEKASYFDENKPGCFIEKHQGLIYVAYYHDAQVKIFDEDCKVINTHQFINGAKPHYVGFLEKSYYVICLGLDEIQFFDYNHQLIDTLAFPSQSGPRHGVHTHDETRLFVLSELSNQVFVVDLKEKQIIESTTITEYNQTTGAAIRLSKDEKHLYVSTRGADIIVHYLWDKHLMHQQTYKCSGSHPRDFLLLDDAILVGYQLTSRVEKIKLDHAKNLQEITHVLDLDKIVCVK